MTNVALFDLDGTLTDSTAIDTQCFVDAFSEEFSVAPIHPDWSSYQSSTDRGLTLEILSRAWGREPREEEVLRHRRRFVELLRRRVTTIKEIPGARLFLQRLAHDGWSLAICTGAWSESAQMKLELAGLADLHLPLATCDEVCEREEILRSAWDAQQRAVYFGDGLWDLRAAQNVGVGFIGVGRGHSAERLRGAGASEIISDYSDPQAVLAAMLRCAR
jgi:phosphoglycolate phosphatase-like HAD superfamily hydrolase